MTSLDTLTRSLAATSSNTAWMDAAACVDEDPELFYPAGESARYRHQATEAIAVCHTCPVRANCLEVALTREGGRDITMRFGIWGGLTPGQRVREHRRRRDAEKRTKKKEGLS